MLGTTLAQRFNVLEELGRGGMGTVYRAHDETLDRDVAIKLLSDRDLGEEARERLLREAQVAARLNHPNIVQVHDVGVADIPVDAATAEPDPVPYIVMELIRGHSLHDRPPDSLPEVIRVARQVCSALQHAHEQDILHRDLKPENVLIDSSGAAKLTDFGLARSMSARITEEGQIAGTVFYMAPEIARGRPADGRADLYSLGIMLYELVTSELPFAQGDPLAIISQHLHASVVPPRARNQQVPPRLNDLILELLRKEPENRPATALEVGQVLDRADILDPQAPAARELALLDRVARGRFVGRVEDLQAARSYWQQVAEGSGTTLLVSGEPGVGKTRLVRELATHVEVTGGRVFIGACYQEGGAPYSPFAQILREVLGGLSEDVDDGEAGIPAFVLSDLLSLTPDLKPYYPHLPEIAALEPQAQQQRLFENFVAFVENLSGASPLVLVIEDAHWAESSSLALFRHVARRLRRAPVMLVATYREVELDEALPLHEVLLDLSRESLAHRLKLNRLTRAETEKLLATIFEEETTDEFLEGIYRETEGNPFFVEEVCKALVESGKLSFEDGRWHRPSMAELEIPQSVKIAVQARLGKLAEPHQEALRMAAVLGREFDFEILAAASELEQETLIEAIEAAEHAQLIQNTGGIRFAFVHALVPNTLVDGIQTLRRRIFHRRAAEAVEALTPDDYPRLAHHYGEAGEDEKALRFYEQAGDQSASAYANREAETYFRAALDIAKEKLGRASLLAKLGLALASQSRQAEAIEAWETAISIYKGLGYGKEMAWCYARAARAAWDIMDVTGGLRICEKGVAEVGDGQESRELADLLHETARAYHFNGDSKNAEGFCRRAREMAEGLGAVEILAESLITWAILEGTNHKDSVEALERAIGLARSYDFPNTESRARNNLAYRLGFQEGKIEEARQNLREAARLSRGTGQLHLLLFYASTEAGWAIIQGKMDYAEEALKDLRQISQELVNPGTSEANLSRMEAYLLHRRGEFEKARKRYIENMEASRAGGARQWLYWNGMWFAQMLIEMNRLSEARSILEEIVDLDDTGGPIPFPILLMAIVDAKTGHVESAKNLLQVDGEEPMGMRAGFELAWYRLGRAQVALAGGQTNRAWDYFSSAVAHVKSIGIRGELGYFLMEWASGLSEYGQDRDNWLQARSLLREARDLYQELETPKYREIVDKRLRELKSAKE